MKFPILDVPFNYHNPTTQYADWKKYVWYDNVHLMDGVHHVLAEKMAEALNEAQA